MMKSMKKNALTLIILILMSGKLLGQEGLKLNYTAILESENYIELEAVLYFEDGESLFYIRNMETANSIKSEYGEEEMNSIKHRPDPLLSFSPPRDSLIHQVYIDRDNEIIKSRRTIFKGGKYHPCVVIEPTNSINWEITNKSREIGSYTAIKAKSAFRGRYYTAWFVPDIDINAGPWKFHGLPGLIIEVTDEEKGVQFLFSKLENFDIGKKPISRPDESIVLTINEFAVLNDPERIAQEFVNWISNELPSGVNLLNSNAISTSFSITGIEREY